MEIKFRGKSVSKEYWCYGYLIIETDGNSYIHWTDEYGNKKAEKVHTESVGQFTGFISKDKKEIYQYDIVNFGNSLYNYFIIFSEGSFVCLHTKKFGDLKEHLRWGLLSRTNELGWDIEIIGNTIDTPELLDSVSQHSI